MRDTARAKGFKGGNVVVQGTPQRRVSESSNTYQGRGEGDRGAGGRGRGHKGTVGDGHYVGRGCYSAG
jgi:hypothetical protein